MIKLFVFALLALFLAATLFIHLRGAVRLPFLRQAVNHSAWFGPYNALMYLNSAVTSNPYADRQHFAELDVLRDNWQTIRDEALKLQDEGYIRDALNNNEAGFGSFFKKGWTRFYLTWYEGPLPSAQKLCPKTVELIRNIPSIKGAMFTRMPPHSHLNKHRDPFAGSLRYHLGLATPNSDQCRIFVDGQPYAWRDGEDVMFDETYVHWVKNDTDESRLILFCDIERPLRSAFLTRLNQRISSFLGSATAPQNVEGERVGGINQAYSVLIGFGERAGGKVKVFKRQYPKAYRIGRPILAVILLVLLVRWLFL